MRIEEAAALRQARVDKAEDVIVGVNRYRLEEQPELDVLEIDNQAVLKSQITRLAQVRASRDETATQNTLAALSDAAASGDGNILALAVEAARARASLGEISDALETVFTRHKASTRLIKGIYADAYADDPEYTILQNRLNDMPAKPHILVAKVGQDGHDRGAKVIATAFADMGFTVDLSDMLETPQEIVEKAIALKVDVVGVSSLAGGHKSLIPEIVDGLRASGRADILVVAGGIIPEQDYEALRDAGIVDIYGPGTNVIDAANRIVGLVQGLRRNEP